jgi:hypothetical protein
MSELKKPSTRGIIAGSLAIVIFLAMREKPESDTIETVRFLSILILAYWVILEWIKYIKKYIDFAMEQKSNKIDNETNNQ